MGQSNTHKYFCNYPKFGSVLFTIPPDADGMASSVEPHQTVSPRPVWSGSTLSA